MQHSTKKAKPDKPHRDFPLYANASVRWTKKVKGFTRYFGHWDEPDATLELWPEQNDDLLAGRWLVRK